MSVEVGWPENSDTGQDDGNDVLQIPYTPNLNQIPYGPPQIDRMLGIRGSYFNIPKAILST